VVVDDLATTGLSKLEGIERLQAAGLVVTDIVVLVDRESGAGPAMAEAGYRLHAAFTITELLGRWERSGAVTTVQADEIRAFLVASRAG
jgi:uridine monophosphate synthetase